MAYANSAYINTDAYSKPINLGKIVRQTITAAQAAAAGSVHAAITGSATLTVNTTTAITNPPYARNLVITTGGTTGDVKASSITVYGTNINGDAISEAFAFTANQNGATTGLKAFKTVTRISIPAQDGAAATFTVTYADKIGVPFLLGAAADRPTIEATVNGVIETTAPTVAASATDLASNTIDLDTALNGAEVCIYYYL
jgi:hypothetical protein